MTDATAARIVRASPRLTALDVAGPLGAAGLASLRALPLRTLRVAAADARAAAAALPAFDAAAVPTNSFFRILLNPRRTKKEE